MIIEHQGVKYDSETLKAAEIDQILRKAVVRGDYDVANDFFSRATPEEIVDVVENARRETINMFPCWIRPLVKLHIMMILRRHDARRWL